MRSHLFYLFFLLLLNFCIGQTDTVIASANIQGANWYKAVGDAALRNQYCAALELQINSYGLTYSNCSLNFVAAIVDSTILTDIKNFYNNALNQRAQINRVLAVLDSVEDNFNASIYRAQGHVAHALDRVLDAESTFHSLARRLDSLQCRTWEKIHNDMDNYAIEISATIAKEADTVVTEGMANGFISLGGNITLVTIPFASFSVIVRRKALISVLQSLLTNFTNYRANHPEQDEVNCTRVAIHKLTHRLARTAHRLEELDHLVDDLINSNITQSYSNFLQALDSRFDTILANKTGTHARDDPQKHYHFWHLWAVEFKINDVIKDVVDKWIMVHKTVAYSLFKPHRVSIDTNCTACVVGTNCTCYIDINITPRPHHPRVLAYLDVAIDKLTRGRRCDSDAESDLETVEFIVGAYNDLFDADARTDDNSTAAFNNDDTRINSYRTTKASAQTNYDTEAANEDGDDLDNDAKKALADVARDDQTIDRVQAAIRRLDASIAQVNRRIHHIRVYYFDIHLGLASVRLEIAKLEKLWRQLKSDWNNSNCNCFNVSCKFELQYDRTPGALPIPSRFSEGAVCQIYCRKNNITIVDVLNCSKIEGMRDDIAEDLIELHRVNRTLTRLTTLADAIVDITNSSGILQQLVAKHDRWVQLREDLRSNVTHLIVDILADLSNINLQEELCELIQHCNDDLQVNCSCAYDSTNKMVNCTHIVKITGTSSDTDHPNSCHDISFTSILGDSDRTKYYKVIVPIAAATTQVGDQNPDPVNECLSPDKKRSVLQQNDNSAVQTSYGVDNGTLPQPPPGTTPTEPPPPGTTPTEPPPPGTTPTQSPSSQGVSGVGRFSISIGVLLAVSLVIALI